MSDRIKSILFLSAALLLTPLVQAAPKMDANDDGEITRIEYMSFKSNSFNKQDKNFDGKLTKKEIRDARQEENRRKTKKRFKDMDKNNDGHITEAEHGETTRTQTETIYKDSLKETDKWFNKMDADKNDHISRLEYNSFLENQFDKQVEKATKTTQKAFARLDLDKDGIITEFEYVDKGRKPGSKTPKNSDPMAGLYANETAKSKKRTRRDGNSDGDITKREDREYNEYYFDKLDKNKDGKLTKKEAKYLFKGFRNGIVLSDR